MTKKDEFIIKQVSCNNCLGTGFTESTTEKKYCKTCNENERCYKCENIPRLGKYEYCTKCDSLGYTEVFIKKSK